MMSWADFIRLQAVEIAALVVLAFLPYFVAVREVGLTLLGVGLIIGGYRVLKKTFTRYITPDGKSVFVTGCDTGIGHALARRLVSLGFRVFAGCYRPDGEGAIALKAFCGPELHIVPLDITKDDSVNLAVAFVKENLGEGGLWAVVNNAGQDAFGDIELTTMSIYRSVLEVNLLGAVRVTKAFLMLIRQSKGRIINVTSVKGRLGSPKTSSYTMAKFAGEGFADCLRLEMRKWGVKVILIEPGKFGGTTAINKNENWDRLTAEVGTMWEEAIPEVKRDYGRDYHFGILLAIKARAKMAPTSLAPVIDAMEDSLMNTDPKARYLIPGGSKLFDWFCVCAVMNQYFPEFVTDFVVERIQWTNYPLPAALRS